MCLRFGCGWLCAPNLLRYLPPTPTDVHPKPSARQTEGWRVRALSAPAKRTHTLATRGHAFIRHILPSLSHRSSRKHPEREREREIECAYAPSYSCICCVNVEISRGKLALAHPIHTVFTTVCAIMIIHWRMCVLCVRMFAVENCMPERSHMRAVLCARPLRKRAQVSDGGEGGTLAKLIDLDWPVWQMAWIAIIVLRY